MKRERLAVVLVVVLATGSGLAAVAPAGGLASSGEQQPMVTLTVTVTDNFDNPVRDATLNATWDGGRSTARTASNGKAFLDVAEGADVEIDVAHRSYTLNNPVVVEDASEQDVSIEAFRKAEATVTVLGGDSPVEGAEVILTKQGEDRPAASGTTDGDGAFTSGTIEKGTYNVSVVEAGYLRNGTTVEVRDTTETTVRLEEGTATVTFAVQDDNFDPAKAIEGATVTVEGPASTTTTTTTGSGERTLGLPANAEVTVTVTKDGYTSETRTVTLGEDDRTLTFTIAREPTLTVEAVNQRVVVGEKVQVTATDEYGERVPNATVLVDGEAVGETNADGSYWPTIESGGEHTVTVEKDGVSGSVSVEGVSPGGGDGTATTTATATEGSDGTAVPIGDFSQPTVVMKLGVAAVGVLLAFLVVRRLL
jgi:hypothetical protein